MATGGCFSDDQSKQEEDSMVFHIENPSLGSNASSCGDKYFENLQTESVQSTVSKIPLWRLHDSCKTPCKKRLYNAVIHCCQADIPLACKVKAVFENMTVTYIDQVQYQVDIALLTDVTPNTEIEALHEICNNEMTTVFIILYTHTYDSDYKSKKVGLKIINTVTKSSSINAIELFFDGDLMRQNEPELLQRELYEPEQREFREKMGNILMGSYFEEHIRHHEIRKACDEERCKRINRTKASPSQENVEESTTESDSLSAFRQLDLAASRGKYKLKKFSSHLAGQSNTKSSDDTSRSSCIARVPPMLQHESNDHNENGENEQNNHSGENDEDEQTFRKLPYTATMFQETPTISGSDSTAANSSQAASPQDLPTTQLPAAINHSQPDSASCPSGEHETIDLSVTNSVSAELMTVERSEDQDNGGDDEERNGDGATGHQELQDAVLNS